jgi:UDP-2,4-diacetamido-2,4,6-trideoxy-beta-L-altropyranose hydrolase
MNPLRIVFRIDANQQIGTGHFMRCLTLADAMRRSDADICFVSRALPLHLQQMLSEHGIQHIALPENELTQETDELPHAAWLTTSQAKDAEQTMAALGAGTWDWMVVDHYALDHRFEKPLRAVVQHVMVIDDLADRVHDCDVLLDQNLGRAEKDYDRLLAPTTLKFIGPRYALIRPDFARLRQQSLNRRLQPQFKKLLITLGGVDKNNVSCKVLQALCNYEKLPKDLQIVVVMGANAPYLDIVQAQARSMPWPTKVLVNIKHMAQIMIDTDLCIGAAGSTSWERCCLGLPTIQLTLAENQLNAANALIDMEAVIGIKSIYNFEHQLKMQIENINATQLLNLSSKSALITNGLGSSIICNYLTA